MAHLVNGYFVLRFYLASLFAAHAAAWPTATRPNDLVNEEMLEAYRSLSVAEVREQFRDAHFALMNVLESSPSVDARRAVAVTKGHYQAHQLDLAKLAGPCGQ
jgi:hypothetical protein